MRKIVKLSAIGTRGKAAGIEFIAKPDSIGKFVLNKKKASTFNSNTNMAVNKAYTDTLVEAYELLKSGQYLINLVCPSGNRALRELSKVRVQYI